MKEEATVDDRGLTLKVTPAFEKSELKSRALWSGRVRLSQVPEVQGFPKCAPAE